MSQYARTSAGDVCFPMTILVGMAAWVHRAQLIHLASLFLGIVSCFLVMKLFWKLIHYHRHKKLKDIDKMNGLELSSMSRHYYELMAFVTFP